MGIKERNQPSSEGSVVLSGGCHNCGGRCPLMVHVKDGGIVRILADGREEPQLRACLRGRAYRQLVYHPDRLKFPMKRVGARGEGRFERISWDEALDTVAGELKRVKGTYGNSAILALSYSGSHGSLHRGTAIIRLLSMSGGYTATWGNASAEGTIFAARAQYGDLVCGSSRDDLLNSRLIIMWGWNPAHTIWGTNTCYYLAQAKEAGAKIIAVDPRFHDSAATFASQWIPIRPGTDAAMMAAMAYAMITEELCDQRFLDTHTIGFGQYKDYVMGIEDGIPKTPSWAESITGVPAATIENLARKYATIKPAALIDGYAPGRSAAGEQCHRSTMTLATMTGNIGIRGGNAAGGRHSVPVGELARLPQLPVPRNPVEAGAPSASGSFDVSLRSLTRVHISKIWDAILRGKAGGYPSDFKLFYVMCANPLNQFPNTNKGVQALRSLEFVVVHELFLTATAKFADIVLPVNTPLERGDLYRPWTSGPYYMHTNKAIDSLYESKSDFEIAIELAPRLGIRNYSDKTEDEWLREFVAGAEDTAKEIQDYDKFKRDGIHRVRLPEPLVAFKKQIEDPQNNPFPTPSGKIEIYSQRLADLNNPKCPPIPKYVETWEGPNDPSREKYPLQLITPHSRRRTHSILDNVPWLRELEPQEVWINSADAEARRIRNGEGVRVFNDRGQMIITAKVTERIMPGIVSITAGAWYDPDEKGIDRGGCANVLTRDEHSPGGAFSCNTALVQVQKA